MKLIVRVVQSVLLFGTCATAWAQQYTISTYAGTGTAGYSGDGGPATKAKLNLPETPGIAVDSAGNLYIAEYSVSSDGSTVLNCRVREVPPAGVIATIAGTGTCASSGDGGPASSAQLNGPAGLAVDTGGNLYISTMDHRVRKVSPSGIITTIAGTGASGYSGDGGPATGARLNSPTGLAVDAGGNLYIADSYNFAVRKVSQSGVITTVAGSGAYGYSGDGGPATQGRLQYLQGVTVDSSGNLYVADWGNQAVRKVTPAGVITTAASGYAYNAVAADGAGNVYATDGDTSCKSLGSMWMCIQFNYSTKAGFVHKISPAGVVSAIAGSGSGGYSGDGGPASSANLSRYVSAAAVDSAGNVYVEDTKNYVIRLLTPPPTPLSITTTSPLTQGTAGASYSQALTATGGAPPFTWAIASGALPPGLTLTATGGIAGTPTTAGSYTFVVKVTDSASASATQSFSLTIGPPTASIVNSASYAGGSVAPGEIVTIFGYNMGPGALAGTQLDSRGYIATTLAGTQVLFDGVAAPLIYTSAKQVSAIVPYAVSGKTSTQVVVSYQGLNSAPAVMPVTAVKPGIFTVDSSGQGPGSVLNQDYSLNTAANPAPVGSVVMVYATGEGQTTPSGVDGKLGDSPAPQPVAQPVTATVGGVSAPVMYAGGAPGLVAGLLQVNVQIPHGVTAGNAVPVVLNIGGSTTQANVTLAIR